MPHALYSLLLAVEDLWDLPLTSTRSNVATLDDLATGLNKQLRDSGGTSFVKKATRPNEVLKLKFDIVLQVIEAVEADEHAADVLTANRARKQQILEIMAGKEVEDLHGKSMEELRALVETL